MADTKGGGFIIQKEKDKPKNKCRKWELRVSIGLDPKTGKYKLSRRVLLEKPEGYVERERRPRRDGERRGHGQRQPRHNDNQE